MTGEKKIIKIPICENSDRAHHEVIVHLPVAVGLHPGHRSSQNRHPPTCSGIMHANHRGHMQTPGAGRHQCDLVADRSPCSAHTRQHRRLVCMAGMVLVRPG
ncbi:hypothetical protein SETIT_3G049200v2 [Setaria italica]|uniref:Uncharacterized protein n=1 Tax=Setaria italica TaxID=4555 RepID=A0A368QBL3_SETIT|nr:hypothetical protein SETIT_3G049200v2 [Setaria italica]